MWLASGCVEQIVAQLSKVNVPVADGKKVLILAG